MEDEPKKCLDVSSLMNSHRRGFIECKRPNSLDRSCHHLSLSRSNFVVSLASTVVDVVVVVLLLLCAKLLKKKERFEEEEEEDVAAEQEEEEEEEEKEERRRRSCCRCCFCRKRAKEKGDKNMFLRWIDNGVILVCWFENGMIGVTVLFVNACTN